MEQPAMFTQNELNQWAQWVNQPYNSRINISEANWIKENISPKLGFWADSLIKRLNNWTKTGKRDFLNRRRNQFRSYLWLKLYEIGKHPELYFTLTVDRNAIDGIPGLVIKLDYQRSYSKMLNYNQELFLKDRLVPRKNTISWFCIEEFESMDWNSLVEFSISFINQYLEQYYELNNQLVNMSGEYRLARLCWNSNGWTEPSGEKGKSADHKTHEGKYHFGHEEWLLDTSKLIDGYHYGFLEPIFKTKEKYVNQSFHIGLYTIDAETKNRYWVGFIKNVIIIDRIESDTIKDQYIRNGWYNEMSDQLNNLKISTTYIESTNDGQLFNIKFRLDDLEIENYEFIPKDHIIYSVSRYTFLKTQHIISSFIHSLYNTPTPFKTRNGAPSKSTSPSTQFRKPKMIQVEKKHRDIQVALYHFLSDLYKPENVTWEFMTESRTQVDIVRKDGDSLIFYEIKTYPSLKFSIREAFGQLMEYAHWSDRKEKIDFVIVTDLPINSNAEAYIQRLRRKYQIPIKYAQFDLSNNKLI